MKKKKRNVVTAQLNSTQFNLSCSDYIMTWTTHPPTPPPQETLCCCCAADRALPDDVGS